MTGLQNPFSLQKTFIFEKLHHLILVADRL